MEEQTGIAKAHEDWFPLSCVTPFSKLISALRGEETTTLSSHPHCALGTYLFVDQNRKAMPVTRFIDVGPTPSSKPGTACASSSMRTKRPKA